jgi:hypothetical protein
MSKAALFVALLALAGAAVAGCGKSQPRLTKDQYVARANAICHEVTQRVTALAGTGLTFDQLAQRAVRIRQRANERLAKLPVPKDDPVPKRWLRLREATLAKARRIFAAKRGSAAYQQAIAAYKKADTEVTEVARRYGMRDCVGPASS